MPPIRAGIKGLRATRPEQEMFGCGIAVRGAAPRESARRPSIIWGRRDIAVPATIEITDIVTGGMPPDAVIPTLERNPRAVIGVVVEGVRVGPPLVGSGAIDLVGGVRVHVRIGGAVGVNILGQRRARDHRTQCQRQNQGERTALR